MQFMQWNGRVSKDGWATILCFLTLCNCNGVYEVRGKRKGKKETKETKEGNGGNKR